MEPTPTLVQDPSLPHGQDYAWLRKEGIKHLQHLSGLVWTDYNLHDPGVTLLEALCFTLTDMSSRAALPVPALLARPPGQAPHEDSLFVPAHQAFANHPVTLPDYRKLLLDQLHGTLRNAWLGPALAPDGSEPPGHYQAYLELHPPAWGEEPTGPADERARVAHRALGLLNAHRNLGELFTRATVLAPYPVAVASHLDLDLGHRQDPTPVLVALLHQLAACLDPAPAATTARQLRAAGQATEDIYAGPLAEHLLFDNNSFGPRRYRVDCAELTHAAQQLKAIRRVSGLALHGPGLPGPAKHANVPADHVAVLDARATLRHLTISQRGAPLHFDAELVLWTYRQQSRPAAAAQRRPHRHEAPPAPYVGLGHYDSVQNLLPALYGTGEHGPRAHSRPIDRVFTMQLKGYLLLFDQLLANFCAQLENVGQLFSPAPQPTPAHGVPLYGVPYVAPLLPGTGIGPDAAWRNDAATAARWQAYQVQPHNPYKRSLRDLAEPEAARRHQRSTFLAHLLARFGYTARQHQAHPVPPESPEQVQANERLLAHLGTATYHRAAARSTPQGYAESGLEFFLFLLTGLESLPRKWRRTESLADLEARVHLPPHHHRRPQTTPHLTVRGPELRFEQLLELFAGLLRQPALAPVTATAARLTPDPLTPHLTWELELPGATVQEQARARPDNLVHRLLDYGRRLDVQAERFTILDHLVLRPHHPYEDDSFAAFEEALPADFYYFQATALLPAYALRFRPAGEEAPAMLPLSPRAFVESLIRQHAPAHLLVNIIWLDYHAMREWERLFANLAAASGLLNSSGQADHGTLPGAQQQARRFLKRHLHHAA